MSRGREESVTTEDTLRHMTLKIQIELMTLTLRSRF